MAKKTWMSMFIVQDDQQDTASEGDNTNLDVADIDTLLAETRALTEQAGGIASGRPPPSAADAISAAAVAPAPPIGTASSIVEGRALAEVYAEQGCVPPSPKSVNEVITFLNGLSSMPEAVQKQALAAMDNADVSWTLDDVVLDARNKVEALNRAKAGLADTMSVASSKANAEIADQDALISNATTTIHDSIAALQTQIAELEQLRDTENTAAEAHKTSAREALKSTVEACGREASRFDTEATRLGHFIKTFGPSA